ncbi:MULTISPECIES: TVP38/TMEM64 family protein [Luteibacter]|uniref:TVP38/TMEM64 family membrane protein n=1 Tax=Luteibacter flocculans TaxID=2780091 RepID=A0ABY4T2F4_9GAMM|nr:MULTISPECIES: VTT domain-containing protein [Luteibacter]URL59117.1 TVP38/TMEM64 family protein [Luteibacter flocculans]SFW57143.1 Uncharacterized membrane protein YdjX, TVP38/TMEM64 family, SNARE-associated domain [Luteibacter sp. UNCMF366Tsu5.1]
MTRRWRTVLPLCLLILIGLGLLFGGVFDRLEPHRLLAEEGQLRTAIATYPVASRLLYAGVLCFAIATGVPGTIVIVLSGGLLFGTWEGTALSSVAVLLGSLALYGASRYAFGPGGREPPPLARRLRDGYAAHPVTYTFALRFVPIVPLGIMTMTLAWLRCPLWLFIVATWLGGTVSLCVESAVGAGLGATIASGTPVSAGGLMNQRLLIPLAAFAVLTLLPLAIRTIRARLRRGR